jgi:N-acetylglucosaminyl-diphospho-decaprenol L-rhamnosyltransferase
MSTNDPIPSDLSDVCIVIPVFNGREVLTEALRLLELYAQDAQIIVVDGGSTDGALEVAKAHSGVQVLEVSNFGWAHASNRGFALASRPMVLTMNSDLFPNRPVLMAMAARLREQPNVAAVGPTLLDLDGSRQRAFTTLYWPNWRTIHRPSQVPVLHGACLMTRRDVLERVGGFDEGFFIYNEELDWCTRARCAGFQLELLPETATHVGGASTGSRTALIEFEEHRGFLRFLEKHHPGLLLTLVRGAIRWRAFFGRCTDRRAEFRRAWADLERSALTQNYRTSPFTLSGRDEVRFERDLESDPSSLSLATGGTPCLSSASMP